GIDVEGDDLVLVLQANVQSVRHVFLPLGFRRRDILSHFTTERSLRKRPRRGVIAASAQARSRKLSISATAARPSAKPDHRPTGPSPAGKASSQPPANPTPQ